MLSADQLPGRPSPSPQSTHAFRADFQGLKLSRNHALSIARYRAAPLSLSDEHSWLPLCQAGQDQGVDGACGVYTIAGWANIMQGRRIGNAETLAAYREYLAAAGLPDNSGLTFAECYQIALVKGWIANARGLQMVLDFQALRRQPVLCGYEIDKGWSQTNAAGCIDHRQNLDPIGNHAVLAVTYGRIGTGLPQVQFNNWWGDDWGCNGFGQMQETHHDYQIREMWTILI